MTSALAGLGSVDSHSDYHMGGTIPEISQLRKGWIVNFESPKARFKPRFLEYWYGVRGLDLGMLSQVLSAIEIAPLVTFPQPGCI